jgi:hypothetical protein
MFFGGFTNKMLNQFASTSINQRLVVQTLIGPFLSFQILPSKSTLFPNAQWRQHND